MLREENDFAFILHSRPYRENSAIVHFFSQRQGKIDLVVNGLRSKKQKRNAFIQSGSVVNIDYQLKTNLGTCKKIDTHSDFPALSPKHFFSVQYVNEILLKSLPSQIQCENVFDNVLKMHQNLQKNQPQQAIRRVELAIIDSFISLPNLSNCNLTGKIHANKHYHIHPEQGACITNESDSFSGSQLIAFNECLCSNFTEKNAKLAKPITQNFLDLIVDKSVIKTKKIHQTLLTI